MVMIFGSSSTAIWPFSNSHRRSNPGASLRSACESWMAISCPGPPRSRCSAAATTDCCTSPSAAPPPRRIVLGTNGSRPWKSIAPPPSAGVMPSSASIAANSPWISNLSSLAGWDAAARIRAASACASCWTIVMPPPPSLLHRPAGPQALPRSGRAGTRPPPCRSGRVRYCRCRSSRNSLAARTTGR